MAIDVETALRCITPRRLAELVPAYPVRYWRTLLQRGRVPGAVKIGDRWVIPVSAVEKLLESGHERDAA